MADVEGGMRVEEAARLVKIPGGGKKTDGRLSIEMRDKIDATQALADSTKISLQTNPKSEAVDALIALGYKAHEVNRLIGNLDVDDKSAEDIIRLALRQVAQ